MSNIFYFMSYFINFTGSVCNVNDSSLFGISVVLLFLNIGCAVQDVVVDGLAITLLEDSQLGLVNSVQVPNLMICV